ncbi:MAG TPA: hypothetical protein VMR99_02040 [Candidatus Paceibacterota bacterium]|nr:hypothetical protein [Candidatus Paceibacterota bacterium]
MEYKPTLGGIEELQRFMERHDHPMPIFEMNIDKGLRRARCQKVGQEVGQMIPINEAIKQFGSTAKMVNLRISNPEKEEWIDFADAIDYGLEDYVDAKSRGFACILDCSTNLDPFLDTLGGENILLRIARWGKEKPSFREYLDKLLFLF